MAQNICTIHGSAYPEQGECPACKAGSKVQNSMPSTSPNVASQDAPTAKKFANQ